MGDLSPVAFDIETSGLGPGAVITVVGLAFDAGSWLCLNTGGRSVPADLEAAVGAGSDRPVRVSVRDGERALLSCLGACTADRLDGDRHYLTAYNGETWNGGFDLPFVRSACVRRDVDWPFPDVAYADAMVAVDRFDTGDTSDLAGVYEALVGADCADPFEDSAAAIEAYEEGDWVALLRHNLADITRTRELARLAGRYVPKSDFEMKSLQPPDG